MELKEVDESDKPQVDDIFYNFPAYDALYFEIQSIHKSLLFFKDIFVTDNFRNVHGKDAVEDKERKILQIMLLNKVVQYMETLGAVALSIISTKSKRSSERFNKSEEKDLFINFLSSYNVGDVVNFYRDIKQRQNSYLNSFLGFPPAVLQLNEVNSFLDLCCKSVVMLLDDMGNYYIKHIDIYNAYKHGYRIVIPDFVGTSKNGFLVNKESNISMTCVFTDKENEQLLKYAQKCYDMLNMIFENNKKSMYVESSKKVKFELKVLMDKETYEKGIKSIDGFLVNYPSTNEEKELLITEQDNVLKKTRDIAKYLYNFVIVDLDKEEIVGSAKTLREIVILERDINPSNRKTTLRITEAKLKAITNSNVQEDVI